MQHVQNLIEALRDHPLILMAEPLPGAIGARFQFASWTTTQALDMVAITKDKGRRLVLMVPRVAPAAASASPSTLRRLIHIGESRIAKPVLIDGVLSLHIELQLRGEDQIKQDVTRVLEELRVDLVLFLQRV